jgi:hypothetical protein
MAFNTTEMVKKNHIVISGKQGEDFLNYFKETTELVAQKE